MSKRKLRTLSSPAHTHSYAYVMAFLQAQAGLLAQPFKLDRETALYLARGDPSHAKQIEAAVFKALAKLNALLAAHCRVVFTKQALSQVSLQAVNYEKQLKLQSVQKVTTSKEFLVPIVCSLELSGLDVSKTLRAIRELPQAKYLSLKQIKNVSETVKERKDHNGEDDEYDSDASIVEIESVEIKELRDKLRQYASLHAALQQKRLRVNHLLLKLSHYKQLHLTVKRELFGGADSKGGSEGRVALVQRNLVTSQSELFDEIAKLRVNLSKIVPRVQNYTGTASQQSSSSPEPPLRRVLLERKKAKVLEYL